jgi:hypothetical protein
VVEKIRQDKKDVEIIVKGAGNTECYVVDSEPEIGPGTRSYREWAHVEHNCACEAILRAALKAVRGEVRE